MLLIALASATEPQPAEPPPFAAEREQVAERVAEIRVLLKTEHAMEGHWIAIPRPEVELGAEPHPWPEHAGWKTLRYEHPAESLCVYWIDVAPDQIGWMVWAHCDMDGDGVEAYYGRGHTTMDGGKWHSEAAVY